ncbi:hypothetical protein HAX54_029591, partial [Datura stramonium]|nr:hypothetical protein [Datura stramonium]
QMLQLRINSVTEEKLQQIKMLPSEGEHSRALYRVGPRFKEPLDDNMATEDEMARVDSDIESSDAGEDDSEMGKATLAPTEEKE